MATAVDAALAEVTAALVTIGKEFEGLKDYLLVNLKPDTHREVNEALVDYTRRVQYMESFKEVAEQLLNDGYPDLAVRSVSAAAYQDLVDQEESVSAALKKFSSNQATAMTVTAGEPVPKASPTH